MKILQAFVALLFAAVLLTGPVLAQSRFLDKLKDKVTDKETVASALSESEIADGLKEALKVGTETVVSQLGATDGFLADPDIHIPLPKSLERAQKRLDTIGLGNLGNDLEERLNRAAEAATPRARALFVSAIQDMTLDDARGILNGPDDSATQYLRGKMSEQLSADMKPVVDDTLAQAGALDAYDSFAGRYEQIPFVLVPDVKADLTDHVTERALDGIFHYVAKEEAAIRQNPVKRTTDILKKVFGAD